MPGFFEETEEMQIYKTLGADATALKNDRNTMGIVKKCQGILEYPCGIVFDRFTPNSVTTGCFYEEANATCDEIVSSVPA
jgi:hypothetical protein